MRMWMTPAAQMCRQHLLGEHVEIHMFIGAMVKGVSMAGYCNSNMMEPGALVTRHRELVIEMERRGYTHRSPVSEHQVKYLLEDLPDEQLFAKVNALWAMRELHRRCPECRSMHQENL